METIKLQKYIAACGLMSRRAAEAEISLGKVFVNGSPASLGDRIDPETDVITYRGKRVLPSASGHTYIMLNKPAGTVTTMKDEEGRPTVADLISDLGVRVYPIGRLDMYSEGLLLLTDDGDLCRRLSHPSSQKEKIYTVTLVGEVDDEKLAALSRPMTITEANGKPYALRACPVSLISRENGETRIEMTLREGRNRQIRRMCESLGLKIKRLVRISEGGLTLGVLPRGKWRHLSRDEVELLKAHKDN